MPTEKEEITQQIRTLERRLDGMDHHASPLYESDDANFDWNSLLFAIVVVLVILYLFCKCSSYYDTYMCERFDSRPSVSANYATRSDVVGDNHHFYFPGQKTLMDKVKGQSATPILVQVKGVPPPQLKERFITGDDVIDRVKVGISTPDGKGPIEFATEFRDLDDIDSVKTVDLHQPEISEDQLRDFLL